LHTPGGNKFSLKIICSKFFLQRRSNRIWDFCRAMVSSPISRKNINFCCFYACWFIFFNFFFL